MGKLRSGRVKRIPQTGITSDRYEFLGLNQAEPNLGDPTVGPSSIGVNPIPVGQVFQPVSVSTKEGERYWTPLVGFGTTVGVISVYQNGFLPNGDNRFQRINGLDFVGTGVTVDTTSVDGPFEGVGIATIRFTVTDILNRGEVGQVLYNTSTGYAYGASQLYYVSDNVGIGSTIPQYKLDILGDARLDGKLSVGGTTGVLGQYLSATGTGVTWSTFPVLRTGLSTVATVGQTGFTTSYNVGFLDVYVNGVRLTGSEYVATNGSTIVLNAPCFGGENVDIFAYGLVSAGSGGGGIGGGGGSSTLAGLSDVNVSSAQTGSALIYNEGIWIDGPIIGGIPGVSTSVNIDSTLLILGDGISGDNTFVDSSIVGAALSAVGSGVSFSDVQSEFGSTSIYFDGTSYIDVQVSTGVTFAAYEDFTLEFWSYQTNTNGYQSIMMWDDGNYEGLQIYNGYLNWYEWGNFTGAILITENNWHHIAVTRQGDILRSYVDGILDNQQSGVGLYSYSGYAAVGVNGTRADEYFEGYLDGINFIKGTALYTGNSLTVPTAEFTTPITGTIIIGALPYSIKNLDDVSDDTPINYQALVWNGVQYKPGIVYPNGNIFVGTNSDCCTSYNNNFFGIGAGFNNTSGRYNNFFGYHAGDGGGNCTNSFGLCAGGGENNNFFGHYAGSSNSTGEHNNFSGEESGRWNTTGSTNNFFGYQAGGSNTTGSQNIFIGDRAGCSNTTGSENIYMGYLSGGFSGNCTVAFGCESGANNAGCNNHFFGVRSGVYNSTGNYNNFLGAYSGHYNDTGSNNNYIGGFTGGSTTASYRIILGQGKKGNTFFNNKYFDSPDTTKDNQFAVGINTTGTSEYWLVGDENFNIGIGTTNPTSKLTVGGDVTATAFYGDGSNLLGVIASGVEIALESNGVPVGAATTINFGTNLSVSLDSGIATVTSSGGGGQSYWSLNEVGIHTLSSVGIGTTNPLYSLDLGGTTRVKGFIESQNTSTFTSNILSLDATQGTIFTHTTSANIGIVSFTGISTNRASTQTFTVLVTQGAVGYNTTAATGIGTQLATIVTEGGVGYSTHIKVGGGTTITLTNTPGALDILTFIVSYNGNVSIANTSFTIVGIAATNFKGVI